MKQSDDNDSDRSGRKTAAELTSNFQMCRSKTLGNSAFVVAIVAEDTTNFLRMKDLMVELSTIVFTGITGGSVQNWFGSVWAASNSTTMRSFILRKLVRGSASIATTNALLPSVFERPKFRPDLRCKVSFAHYIIYTVPF